MIRQSVIFGGPSPEHDVSILTGLQVCQVLSRAGHEVLPLYWTKTGDWYAVDTHLEAADFITGVPPKSRPVSLSTENGFAEQRTLGRNRPLEFEVAVNCCHGGPGEDGRLQSLLDLCGIAYTGPTARSAALGMDKLAFGSVVAAAGLPTLQRFALLAEGPPPAIPLPWIVKPRFGGSSIGIQLVDGIETARELVRNSVHLRLGAVIEPYLTGAVDLNVSVRGHGAPLVSEIERPLRESSADFYNYEHKYLGGQGIIGAPRELPAELPPRIRDQVRNHAAIMTELTQVRGVARMDFLLHDEQLWINEINTIPGAMSFYLWHATGVSHQALLEDMLEEAMKFPAYEPDATGADGLALRSAGAIASKLV